jgi:RHS repeat-associated protein
MLARWIATVAALLLACANPHASAHVRAEAAFGPVNAIERAGFPEKASPSELARKSKTAPPARARLADLAPGKNDALSHCHVWQKSLSEQKRTSGVAVYTWDAEGRLTQAITGNGAAQKAIAYRYDPNGIRRSQQVTEASGAEARTEYLVDPNQAYAQVLEEWGASAASGPLPDETLATTYVYGDDLISQTKLALAGPSVTSVYHYDGLGTTRALSAYKVDAAGVPQAGHGEITDRYAYTAFGESDPAGTSGDTSGSSENNYRYTGEQLDPNLGFYYLRARYMDPGQGRFLRADTWSGRDFDPGTLHKYLYANGNPVTWRDPSGLLSLIEVQTSNSVQDILSVIRTTSAGQVRSAAFRRLGQLAQEQVGKLAKEVLEEVAEEILLDGLFTISDRPDLNTRFDGSQRRVLDFYATAGQFVADIEVKYGLPRRGSDAMRRLISQTRSMRRGPNSLRVLIIMSDNVSDAAIARLRRSLRGGRAGPVEVLNGAGDVVDFFRRFYLR